MSARASLVAVLIVCGCSPATDRDQPAPTPTADVTPTPVASPVPPPSPVAAPPVPVSPAPPPTPIPAGLKGLVFGMTLDRVKEAVGNKLEPVRPTFTPDPGVPYSGHGVGDTERTLAWRFLWDESRKMVTPLPGTWRKLATDIGGTPASCQLGFIEADLLSAIQCTLTGEQGPRALADALAEVLVARHGSATEIKGGRRWANDAVILELRLEGEGEKLAVILDNRNQVHDARITAFRAAQDKRLDDRFVAWLGAQSEQLERERRRIQEQRTRLERDLSPPAENPIE